MGSETIRKFERFLMSCKADRPVETKREALGTFHYDFKNQTETYTPNPKHPFNKKTGKSKNNKK